VGYTHYWSFTKGKQTAAATEKAYQKAMLECANVVRYWYLQNGGISGYTAHTKPGSYGGLTFNGKGDEGCETFVMREHYSQNEKGNFCKTNNKEYDILVVACLAILKYRLKDAIEVSSDGTTYDWNRGVNLAQTILKRKVQIPSNIRQGALKAV
jgi:hypothetical protein